MSRIASDFIRLTALACAVGCSGDESSRPAQDGGPGNTPQPGPGNDAGTSGANGGDDAAPADPGKGRVLITFAVSRGVRRDPSLRDPLAGTVHGAIYRTRDVGLTGPVSGARSVASIELASVDLRSEGATSAPWTSAPLAPGDYTFLGFLDVDGNAAARTEPDVGDPATLPSTNEFTVKAGQDVTLAAVFDLVFFSF